MVRIPAAIKVGHADETTTSQHPVGSYEPWTASFRSSAMRFCHSREHRPPATRSGWAALKRVKGPSYGLPTVPSHNQARLAPVMVGAPGCMMIKACCQSGRRSCSEVCTCNPRIVGHGSCQKRIALSAPSTLHPSIGAYRFIRCNSWCATASVTIWQTASDGNCQSRSATSVKTLAHTIVEGPPHKARRVEERVDDEGTEVIQQLA